MLCIWFIGGPAPLVKLFCFMDGPAPLATLITHIMICVFGGGLALLATLIKHLISIGGLAHLATFIKHMMHCNFIWMVVCMGSLFAARRPIIAWKPLICHVGPF